MNYLVMLRTITIEEKAMNINEFQKIKARLVAEVAAAMAQALRDMGDDIEYVDWVSYRPMREAEQMAKAA